MPHRRPALLALVVGVVACGRSGGGGSADAPPPIDARAPDAVVADAAAACPASAASTVMVGGTTLGFAALGNVDMGGESACGGPPEGIDVVLSPTAERADLQQLATFQLALPVATGIQTVTVYADGGHTQMSATLDVAQVTVAGAGPGLSMIEGTLSGAVTGHFVATHCASLDVSCI